MEKIENIKLNKEQEEIINNFLNKNACFVNASAGTGKTTTITEVYIKLLEAGEKVSNIVVITFTKAAANEMLLKIRNRIRKKINEEISKKDYWQKIYKELLLNSKISTINAFAHSIVKEYSMRLGMPPNIYILEEDNEADEILSDGILNILDESECGKKVKKIYRIYTGEDKEKFIKTIFNFLIKIKPRLENIEAFERVALECINIDDKKYNKLYNDIINHSNDIINDNSKQNKTINECKEKIKKLLECINKIENKNNKLNYIDFENIRENLILVSNAKLGNTKAEELKNFLLDLNNCCSLMIKYIDAIYNKENYIAVIEFIKETFNQFEEIKKENGIYSHEDIMSKAIESLEIENISKEIRGNINALILDEAQDTSKLQFSFINLIVFGKREIEEKDINEELKKINKKILIVGDRKQSIYRFRNANLNIYNEVKDIFKNYSVDLKNNYRSNSMLIEFFNSFFKEIFFGDNLVKYNDGDDILFNKKTEKKSVSLFVLNNNFEEEKKLDINSKTNLEAYSIANYIKENYKKEEYKETVILLQTFSRLNIYLSALSDLKIPYYVDGGNGFYKRAEIENIILFLKYLILKDYSVLPKLLRTEFFDINIGNLSDFSNSLLSEELDLKDYFSLNALYSNKFQKANKIAKEKNYFKELEKNKELLNYIEKKSATINSSDIIETICIETNYYNYLMTKEDAELCYANIEKLKWVAYDFEDKSGKNSYDFVMSLTSAINDISYASVPKLSVEAVKVMTIHKSKGLEFKNVFLAGAGYQRNATNDRFDFIEDYPVVEIPVHNYIKDYKIKLSNKENDYNKNADLSEKRRLLYVALTRAGENLIISGENSRSGKNSYRSYINDYVLELKELNNEITSESQKKLIEIKNINNNFVNFYSYGFGIKPNEEKNTKEEEINRINKILQNMPENTNAQKNIENEINNIQYIIPSKIGIDYEENNFKNIAELLNKKLSNLEFEKEETDEEEEKIKISPINMGTIMHELLENFDFDKYFEYKENYIEKLKTETLKYYNYYDSKDLKEKLDKYFNNFTQNEHIKNIINGNEKIISREHKFQSRKLENKILSIINAKIDLITKNLNGDYFILDYKTSKQSAEKIEFYQSQLNIYKEIVKESFNIENENNLKTDIIFLG
ncbi:UvrD-helicase domain-containing protein [Brachyspira sp.]|uniref:UvrD-helicase domain-containing protein n=1 Tax=Brachyspira sp. TaxID=1977261 RepID=UPI003D7EF8D5